MGGSPGILHPQAAEERRQRRYERERQRREYEREDEMEERLNRRSQRDRAQHCRRNAKDICHTATKRLLFIANISLPPLLKMA